MELLLVEGDPARRVALARHLCRCGHRVTLASSLAEAREIMDFVRVPAQCPAAALVAEDLLGRRGDAFRAELAARFPRLAWVPVRRDVDLDWLGDWLQRTVAWPARKTRATGPTRRAQRRCLDILLLEPDDEVRREAARRLRALGDRVVAHASLAAARRELDRALPLDVLVAPVLAYGGETISLFLAAQKRLPALRWIVSSAPQPATPSDARPPLRLTFGELDRVRRSIESGHTPA